MTTILGQERALTTLNAALRSGRMHHAWIFAGPRGVGKFTTALELARILLDSDAAAHHPAEQIGSGTPDSAAARLIDAAIHPDLHVIRKELALDSDNPQLRGRKLMNIPLDLLRERMIGGRTQDDRTHDAPAYRTALRGGAKVFIIDEAELIDPVAQNALLKTLEEPPPRTFIILVTSRPDRLLPTIRSRCQFVRFGSLSEEMMRRWADQWLANRDVQSAADPGSEDEATAPGRLVRDSLPWILGFAAGSPGMALLAIEYGFHDWHRALSPMIDRLLRGDYPADMGETLAALTGDFAERWVKSHRNASKDAANKDGMRHLMNVLACEVRSRLAAAAQRGDDAESLLRAVELMQQTERMIETNVNMKLALENLVVQWARGEVTSQIGA
jgi:DNA polymerase-3 subunit delta'